MKIEAKVFIETLDTDGNVIKIKAGQVRDVEDFRAQELIDEDFAVKVTTKTRGDEDSKKAKKRPGPNQTTKRADGTIVTEKEAKRQRGREELLGTSAQQII